MIDSFKLARQIYLSGFRPKFIVGVWRGGTPVGIAVQEFLDFVGVKTDHFAIRTSSYLGPKKQSKVVRVHGLDYLIENINAEDQLLIVDDVFDSGRSVAAILAELEKRMRKNMPQTIKVATPWYNPDRNTTGIAPDFYMHKTNIWLVFPHELSGFTLEEIAEGKPEVAEILSGLGDDSLSKKRQSKKRQQEKKQPKKKAAKEKLTLKRITRKKPIKKKPVKKKQIRKFTASPKRDN